MLSRFDFLLGTARSFGFLVGEALFFFQKIKLDFLRQNENIYSCKHRKCFYNCY